MDTCTSTPCVCGLEHQQHQPLSLTHTHVARLIPASAGRVVKELNERKAHVCYRDSALTMLLRASLDGPSCTGVVINVSGHEGFAEETLCSLRFGEKLASVQVRCAPLGLSTYRSLPSLLLSRP